MKIGQWGKVLFLVESVVQWCVVHTRHVRRPTGKRFGEKYTISTTKHPPSQMIWGAMWNSGTAGLYFLIPGTAMNGEMYVELLKEKLTIHMHIIYA